MNDQDITEKLLRLIGRADDEFQEQIADGIGCSLEELLDYIDYVEFPMIGRKNKQSL
jgi:hypothetical protein